MQGSNVCKQAYNYRTLVQNNLSRFCGGYCPVDIGHIHNTNEYNWDLIYQELSIPLPPILKLSDNGNNIIPYELIYFMDVTIDPPRGVASGNKCISPCSYKMGRCYIQKMCNTSKPPLESNIETCTNNLQFGINLVIMIEQMIESLIKMQRKLSTKATKHFGKKDLTIKVINPFTRENFSIVDLQTFISSFKKGIETISYNNTLANKITTYGTYSWGASIINSLLSNPINADRLLDTLTLLLSTIGAILDVSSTKPTQGVLRLGGLSTGRFKTASTLEYVTSYYRDKRDKTNLKGIRNIKDITRILNNLYLLLDQKYFKQEGGGIKRLQYNYIYDPITNEKVSIFSRKGKQILKNYKLNQI